MRTSLHGSFLFIPLLFASITAAACGGDGGDATSASSTGSGSSSSSSGAGGGDPCAGLSCGDMCSTCPEGAACAEEACDASGKCVEKSLAVCSVCPDTQPAEGSPCPKTGLVCELDEGIIIVCRARALCTANGWKTNAPGCSSIPMADPACPASEPVAMQSCDLMNDPGLCEYADSFCGCTNCLGGPCGGPAEWRCASPPMAPCPPAAPKLGAVCADEGAKCAYGACALGGTAGGRNCINGIWVEEIINCPQ